MHSTRKVFGYLSFCVTVFCLLSAVSCHPNGSYHPSDRAALTPGRYAYLYQNLKVYFLRWYLPLVVCLGTFGTVFCLIFLFLSRLFPLNMLLWLVSICIGDFLILVLEGIWMTLKAWDARDIRDINNALCVLHTSVSNYMFYWSAYMQTMLSMQRAFLIIRPVRATRNGPNMMALIIVWCTITVLLIFPILPYPIYWRVVKNDCDPTDRRSFRVTTLCDFIIWGLIPLTGMTTATVIICWNIFRAQRTFRSDSKSYTQTRQSSILFSPTTDMPVTLKPDADSKLLQDYMFELLEEHKLRISNRKKKQKTARYSVDSIPPILKKKKSSTCLTGVQSVVGSQRHGPTDNAGHVTRLLISMNIWYMFSTYPLIIYLMVLNFCIELVDDDVHRFMYYLCRSLCFLNACCNWIFYCASGRLFRHRIRQIVCRFWRRIRFGTYSSEPYEYSLNFRNNPVNSGNLRMVRSVPALYAQNDNLSRDIQCFKSQVLKGQSKREPTINLLRKMTESRNLSPVHATDNHGNKFWEFVRSIPLFKCHCLCVLPSVRTKPVILTENEEIRAEIRTHRVCCTGFCCWKFWWYGLRSGRLSRNPGTQYHPTHSSLAAVSPERSLTSPASADNHPNSLSLMNYMIRYDEITSHPSSNRITDDAASEWQAECIRSCSTNIHQTDPVHLSVPKPSSSNCYCYMSSLGKGKYDAHLCQLHKGQTTSQHHSSNQNLSF